MDTHALSVPARASALEVLAANGVTVMIAEGAEHLRRVLGNALVLVGDALAAAPHTDDAGRPAPKVNP